MNSHHAWGRDAFRSPSARALGMAALICVFVLLIPCARSAAQGASKQSAPTLEAKIAELAKPQPGVSRLEPIVITEAEATSYLRSHGGEFLPAAVHDPQLKIAPEKISATADVDFDELGAIGRQTDDWGARLVALVFSGRQRVVATGRLETAHGQGTVRVDSLSVGSTDIPAAFVNFLLQEYVERRYKLDLSKPFGLPPQVTHIELAAGRATFHRAANPLQPR